ncbi:unnamed protein product [Gordionus sp. m RMFG-2023]|uniref:density-regulated protein homolog n=1 Tax=Gordionus sp. m RMFG-2023 TaxID=3053472 RepID=UPI0030E4902E
MPSQQQKNKLKNLNKQQKVHITKNQPSDNTEKALETEFLQATPDENITDDNDSIDEAIKLNQSTDFNDEVEESALDIIDKNEVPIQTKNKTHGKYPLQVQYCGICSMPYEYCQYSPTFDQCQKWLNKNFPKVYQDLYMPLIKDTPDINLEALVLNESDETRKRQTRGGKGMNSAAKLGNKGKINPSNSFIKVFNAPRGKKKSVTVVTGLEDFGVDMKAASKCFASRFSCGASVTATDEIVIQGDVKAEILDLICEKWPEIPTECVKDFGVMKR